MKHGITIREKATQKIVQFIPCEVGNKALRILRGIRINLSKDYMASEEYIDEQNGN